jgi:hypothetical protein
MVRSPNACSGGPVFESRSANRLRYALHFLNRYRKMLWHYHNVCHDCFLLTSPFPYEVCSSLCIFGTYLALCFATADAGECLHATDTDRADCKWLDGKARGNGCDAYITLSQFCLSGSVHRAKKIDHFWSVCKRTERLFNSHSQSVNQSVRTEVLQNR